MCFFFNNHHAAGLVPPVPPRHPSHIPFPSQHLAKAAGEPLAPDRAPQPDKKTSTVMAIEPKGEGVFGCVNLPRILLLY